MKQTIFALAVALTATTGLATPAVGVASFEDGTSTLPLQVWFAPGSVTNVADGHEGTRGVAATGNVRIVLNPAADQTRLAFWMKTSSQTHITGLLQFYDVNWVSLRQDNLDLAADRVWREQVLRLQKPANTAHVYACMYLPSGVTATFDDVTGAGDNPAGAVDGFETGGGGAWSVWYAPGSVLNTNAVSHAGARSVAVSGNVKFGVAPIVSQATFWHRRAGGSATLSWQTQYFDASWTSLGQDVAQSATSDTTWRQATVSFAAPANTRYVLVGVWPGGTGDGATVNIDDFATTATVQPSVRPFGNASPWNVPAADLPLTLAAHPELNSVHWWVNREQYSIPVVNSAAGDPAVAVVVAASHGRPASVVTVKMPSGVNSDGSGDSTMQVNAENGIAHSFWKFNRTSDTAATAQAYGSTPLDGDGFTDPATGLNAGIRAGWCSTMGGLLTGPEIAAGEIEHALAVALPGNMLARGWVAPSLNEDSNAASTYTGSIPIGSRLVVPATDTMPAGLSTLGQKIWRAAQRYGFLVVDQAGVPVLYADPRTTTSTQINPLRSGSPSDLDRIVPHLQVARD